jgi:hypothetical protein
MMSIPFRKSARSYSMLASAAAVSVLAGVAMLPQSAAARSGYWSYADDGGPDYWGEGVVPGVRQADGQVCVKQCPNDQLPCDPPVYKQADGRCAQDR